MRHARHYLVSLFALLVSAGSAQAVPWVFKYDQFDSDLTQAANQVNGGQFYTQPGFVAGEAFGQIYKPTPEMFPLTVTGFDIIMAAPPGATQQLYANATIEVYNSSSTSADPGTTPIFTVSTGDLFNSSTQQIGVPLSGNYGISVDFGQGDPEDRPPLITSGNIWLVIRFSDAARDMSSEWGTFDCASFDIGGQTIGCGCQNVGTVHDNDITGKANVLNIVTPLGECSGNKSWVFMESLSSGSGFHIDGDVILRLKADVASGPCVADCTDKECGDDGCGGDCGDCGDLTCYHNECVSCAPSCASKQCGDNGCGGSCGTCNSGSTCGGDFFCHLDCTPSCTNKECGNDGCGGSCGTCTNNESCNASGQCVAGCVSDCADKECGDNGCGGSCGSCGGGETCQAGTCASNTCEPDCGDHECGSDGCGGSCGTCPSGEHCDAGACTPDATQPAAFEVTDVSPDSAFANEATPISITGRGFEQGAMVKVGATDCSDVSVTGSGLISATVPGLPVGTYSVIVINPGGDIATLPAAFAVHPVDLVDTKGKSDGGCGGAPLGLGVGLCGLLVLATRRRFSR